MLVKIHPSYRSIIAICDENLLGKTFQEGNRQITLNEHFFGGDKKEEKEILEIIQKGAEEDYTFNIVGEKSVGLALKCGIIKAEGVIKIQDIPIALVLL